MIHKTQLQIIKIIQERKSLPPLRELQKILGLSSTSLVSHHINQLKSNGYIKWFPTETIEEKVMIEQTITKVIPARYEVLVVL